MACVRCALYVLAFCRLTRGDDTGCREYPYEVGVSLIDITPSTRVWLSGFSSRTRGPTMEEVTASSGALKARVLVMKRACAALSNRPSILVIVTVDLIGCDAAFADRFLSRLRVDHGLSRHEVHLCFSHTHSGPFVGGNLSPLRPESTEHDALISEYEELLVHRLSEAVRSALAPAGLTRAKAFFRVGVSTAAVNRRAVPETSFHVGGNRGLTDDSVPVLWFEATTARGEKSLSEAAIQFPVLPTSRQVVGGIFGYAAHASVITGGYTYSADYPGYAASELEGTVGGVWGFVSGASGDQNVYPRGTTNEAAIHGRRIGRVVLNVVTHDGQAIDGQLYCNATLADIPYRKRFSKSELRRLSRSGDATSRRMANTWLEHLREHGESYTPASYTRFPLAVCRIGGIQVTFLGGEPTVGYAKRLAKSPHHAHWLIGYADDVMGYVGTRDVLDEGGREGSDRAARYYGLPGAWDPCIEETLLRHVAQTGKGGEVFGSTPRSDDPCFV